MNNNAQKVFMKSSGVIKMAKILSGLKTVSKN
jgi:hypothetical protein